MTTITTTPTLIVPSMLDADFSRLGAEVTELELAGADRLHRGASTLVVGSAIHRHRERPAAAIDELRGAVRAAEPGIAPARAGA